MENPLCTTATPANSTVSVLLWTTIAVFGIVYTLLGGCDCDVCLVMMPFLGGGVRLGINLRVLLRGKQESVRVNTKKGKHVLGKWDAGWM